MQHHAVILGERPEAFARLLQIASKVSRKFGNRWTTLVLQEKGDDGVVQG